MNILILLFIEALIFLNLLYENGVLLLFLSKRRLMSTKKQLRVDKPEK